MKLNFRLAIDDGCVELVQGSTNWDLHNWADLTTCCWDQLARTLRLNWVAATPDQTANPWGDPENRAAACELIFTQVSRVTIVSGDSGKLTDAVTLASIAKVIPDEVQWRTKPKWHEQEAFNLLLVFEDDSEIEISAESAELRPINARTDGAA